MTANATRLPESLIPASEREAFLEWARDGGYDESHFDRHDSKSRALEETYLEEMREREALEGRPGSGDVGRPTA